MPENEERRPVLPAEQEDELAEAHALLKDPANVAPVDRPKFAKRLSEIVVKALRRERRTMKR